MRMRKWAAYLLCFLSLALLGISGHFLADYAKQEEKADILQEQLKEIEEEKNLILQIIDVCEKFNIPKDNIK